MRRTRILATLGPASRDEETVAALIRAGADAFRINFSHGTVAEHAETVERVRKQASQAGAHVAILQDLSGPKIRTGPVSEPFALNEGDTLVIEQGTFVGGPDRVSCSFDPLFTSLQPGLHVLVDDGRIDLEVTATAPGRLTMRVANGGVLSSHKGINVPGAALRTSALTPKDVDDLRAGIGMGVDLVALSFVQSADDVKAARAAAAAAGAPDLPVIAKIERPQALEHLDEIVRVSDGLMVARGDLGVEVPLESIPAIQKRVIRTARERGVPVIIATQVLESMVKEPRPTRAEVTDAAAAVDQHADAIMLSGETAVGKFPVRAVATLAAIISEAETVGDAPRGPAPDNHVWTDHGRGLCEAAVTLATSARAAAIIAITRAGKTARMLAALRPSAAILAATPNRHTASRLSLVWGITPVLLDETALRDVRESVVARGLIPRGSVVVLVAVRPALGEDDGNYVHVERA
jgi:pyruvate kinase